MENLDEVVSTFPLARTSCSIHYPANSPWLVPSTPTGSEGNSDRSFQLPSGCRVSHATAGSPSCGAHGNHGGRAAAEPGPPRRPIGSGSLWLGGCLPRIVQRYGPGQPAAERYGQRTVHGMHKESMIMGGVVCVVGLCLCGHKRRVSRGELVWNPHICFAGCSLKSSPVHSIESKGSEEPNSNVNVGEGEGVRSEVTSR